MKKIKSLFQRHYHGNRQVYNEVVPGSEWVIDGKGTATQKHDGTCCLIENGEFFKRYEVKKGKTPPPKFVPATDFDPNTGKQQGWVPVGSEPEDQYHREGFEALVHKEDGTYELCGPKVQGNPENLDRHILIRHGSVVFSHTPRDFDGIKRWLDNYDVEGVVWHHPDGRMVKIKKSDFGLKRSA